MVKKEIFIYDLCPCGHVPDLFYMVDKLYWDGEHITFSNKSFAVEDFERLISSYDGSKYKTLLIKLRIFMQAVCELEARKIINMHLSEAKIGDFVRDFALGLN